MVAPLTRDVLARHVVMRERQRVAASHSHACGVRVRVLSDLHSSAAVSCCMPIPMPMPTSSYWPATSGQVAGLGVAATWWHEHPIVYVSGNHEPYRARSAEPHQRARIAAATFNGRVHILERDEATIGGAVPRLHAMGDFRGRRPGGRGARWHLR